MGPRQQVGHLPGAEREASQLPEHLAQHPVRHPASHMQQRREGLPARPEAPSALHVELPWPHHGQTPLPTHPAPALLPASQRAPRSPAGGNAPSPPAALVHTPDTPPLRASPPHQPWLRVAAHRLGPGACAPSSLSQLGFTAKGVPLPLPARSLRFSSSNSATRDCNAAISPRNSRMISINSAWLREVSSLTYVQCLRSARDSHGD